MTRAPQREAEPPHYAENFVHVIEVGMRDGLQIERTIIPAAEKIALVNRMIGAGFRHIEVTSFVSSRAVPQLADAEEVLAGISRRPETDLMALIPNRRAAERACTTPLTGGVLLCSASNTHNRKNVNRTIDESLAGFPEVADRLRTHGIRIQGAIATTFGCPFEGEVPFANVRRIAEAYVRLGARHVTLSDTTGMAAPPLISRIVRAMRAEFPDVEFTLHLHNTRGIGLVNAMAGLQEGIRRFDSSVGGLGGCPFAAGATGNICTEDLLFLLAECGFESGIDLEQTIAIAHSLEQRLGHTLVGQVMRAGPRLRLHSAEGTRAAAG